MTTILEQNQSNLDNALRLIGPYYNLLNNAVGNGRWLDVYICGLFTRRGDPAAERHRAAQLRAAGTDRERWVIAWRTR